MDSTGAFHLDALEVREVSGVDDPANGSPGWMILKSLSGMAEVGLGPTEAVAEVRKAAAASPDPVLVQSFVSRGYRHPMAEAMAAHEQGRLVQKAAAPRPAAAAAAEFLAALREARSITKSAVAAAGGLDESTIRGWEAGEHVPDGTSWRVLKAAYQMSPEQEQRYADLLAQAWAEARSLRGGRR